jgi:predicted DNA-binding protein
MTAAPTMNIHATPYRQFPLRLPAHMADELDRVSKSTRINKTTISRIALEKFLAEIDRSGASAAIEEVCEI